jgi:hypothetical protein
MENIVTYSMYKQSCNISRNSKILLRYSFMPYVGIGQDSLKWFGMRLATGHRTKTETRIEEPSSLLDSWHRILARSPLTPGSNPLEVVFFIDFDN